MRPNRTQREGAEGERTIGKRTQRERTTGQGTARAGPKEVWPFLPRWFKQQDRNTSRQFESDWMVWRFGERGSRSQIEERSLGYVLDTMEPQYFFVRSFPYQQAGK